LGVLPLPATAVSTRGPHHLSTSHRVAIWTATPPLQLEGLSDVLVDGRRAGAGWGFVAADGRIYVAGGQAAGGLSALPVAEVTLALRGFAVTSPYGCRQSDWAGNVGSAVASAARVVTGVSGGLVPPALCRASWATGRPRGRGGPRSGPRPPL